VLTNLRPASVLVLLVCPFANAQTNQTYYLSAVPTPSGSSGVGQVFALDSNGEIVGNLYQGSSQQSVPAAWTKSAVRLFISPLQNGPQIYLSGANRTGGAVGSGVDITANTVNVFLDSPASFQTTARLNRHTLLITPAIMV
jgi:hypothetical protein